MADYISREAAIEALCKAHSPYPRRREISVRAIQDISPADVRPVADAEWIDNGNETISCSRCQTWFPKERLPYMRICGYCGADMRKVVEIDQFKEGAE